MIEIPDNLPSELVPLSWLIGVWEGTGVVAYEAGENDTRNHEFGHRMSFSHDGLPHLNYTSYTWLLSGSEDDGDLRALATETGYWRLSRPATDGDPGPGLLPGTGLQPFTTARSVEALRNAADGFDIEVSLVHPGGVSELYVGQVKGPRIDLVTDAVMRSANSKEHTASTRLYGLVDNHLLWAWDIAALGRDLRTHASGRLTRVE
jgi:hypothetical protein